MDKIQVCDYHINMEGHRIGALADPQSDQEAMTLGAHNASLAPILAELAALRAAIIPAKTK